MKNAHYFSPSEIIFAATDACNLHCPHCFVNRFARKLDIKDAAAFIKSAANSQIDTVGFSGGEPFLYTDFLTEIIKQAVSQEFMFDRIMTNGLWWNSENDLLEKLQAVYDAGFDGKIGLSIDSFHETDIDRIIIFISTVFEIFNNRNMIEIQSVISSDAEDTIFDLEAFDKIADAFNLETSINTDKKTGKGQILLFNEECQIPVWREVQSFKSTDERAWKSRKWFKDDYCEGPGQILFVHPDGNIAPCCGFANENPELFIGNIKMTLEEVLSRADKNRLVKICYEDGLSRLIKPLKKQKALPGKTQDMCAFCDFVCKNLNRL